MRTTLLIIFAFVSLPLFAQPLEGLLKNGPHRVGFKIIETKDDRGVDFRIGLWYPAQSSGRTMYLKDYIETGLSGDKQSLRDEFKHTLELPFLFGIDEITSAEYQRILETLVNATSNATMKEGKWPLIISDTEPVSLCVTNEWLSSHGFVVAIPVTNFPPPKDATELYNAPTQALNFIMEYMMKQSFIDIQNISALGFGGGSQAAFYLAMQTVNLKSMINIEGGIFQPESKTTLSAYYKPDKFNLPLLHIVREEIIKGENSTEFNAIRSKKYRATVLFDGIRHHDFTIYGRVVNVILKERGQFATLADQAFTEVHEMVLRFLTNKKIESKTVNHEHFKLEEF